MIRVERGVSGLYYATSADDRGVFVAAETEDDALAKAALAQRILRCATAAQFWPLPGHSLHETVSGMRLIAPDPHWMNEAQRCETLDRMPGVIRALAQRTHH